MATSNERKVTADEIGEALEHDASCRCVTCRKFWQTFGPDERGSYGPFTDEEVGRKA